MSNRPSQNPRKRRSFLEARYVDFMREIKRGAEPTREVVQKLVADLLSISAGGKKDRGFYPKKKGANIINETISSLKDAGISGLRDALSKGGVESILGMRVKRYSKSEGGIVDATVERAEFRVPREGAAGGYNVILGFDSQSGKKYVLWSFSS